MSLKKFVVITDMPGVHKMVGNRNNGLIVENIDSGKRKFVSARRHQFTPLESISIYTNDGNTIPLSDVFKTINEKGDSITIPNSKVSQDEAFDFLEQILPNYDKDQVYHSDIKKIIKWYTFLNDRNQLDFTEEEETENEEMDGEITTEIETK